MKGIPSIKPIIKTKKCRGGDVVKKNLLKHYYWMPIIPEVVIHNENIYVYLFE
jgi:hypothetical protein